MLDSLRSLFGASSAWWLSLGADGSLRDMQSTCPVPSRVRTMLAAECASSELHPPKGHEVTLHTGRAAVLVPRLRPALDALGLAAASSVWASWRGADQGGVHIGALRDTPFEPDATERLRDLLPLLRAALRDELENIPLRIALSDALERLDGPAFALDEDDRILAKNARGAALLADGSLDVASVVAEAAAGRENSLGLILRARLVVQSKAGAGERQCPLAVFALEHGLSPRQTEVLGLLCEGLRNGEIAVRLGTAQITVEQHVTALFKRTGTRSRTELVARVLGHRQLPRDP